MTVAYADALSCPKTRPRRDARRPNLPQLVAAFLVKKSREGGEAGGDFLIADEDEQLVRLYLWGGACCRGHLVISPAGRKNNVLSRELLRPTFNRILKTVSRFA